MTDPLNPPAGLVYLPAASHVRQAEIPGIGSGSRSWARLASPSTRRTSCIRRQAPKRTRTTIWVTIHRAGQWLVQDLLRTARFQEPHVTVERLAKGRAFHAAVQTAFLNDLAHATGFRERGWRLMAGGRGRVDLAVVTDDR